MTKIKRALLSVSDKSGLIELARALAGHGVELISTGGTAKAIAEDGLKVIEVAEVTQFPEMMEGRVKTLHPMIHGGLLARRDKEDHVAAMKSHGIEGIDLLVVNLYPFEDTVAGGADFDTIIENIDIGGPAMTRSAAKNHADVAVIVDPQDYTRLIEEMAAHDGGTTAEFRRTLAARAFARTAAYDAAISGWFAEYLGDVSPRLFALGGSLKEALRYGENPHQAAGFYVSAAARPGVATARQVQGKALSYNNINDTDAAYECIAELGDEVPAIAIIKHANPCGVALGATLEEAYRKALKCDPVSAFGGIVATNKPLDGRVAEAITQVFTEVVIAPGADQNALEIFASKKNLRLLITDGLPDPEAKGITMKTVAGGFLMQERDAGHINEGDLKVVTKRQPTEQELADLLLAFRIGKHVKSNTIVYVKDGATVGVGAGQMSRIDSARIAAWKAKEAAETAGDDAPLTIGSVAASDAFFPFADGLMVVAEAGATAVIQPGGSMRDDEVIAAADEAGLAMVLTGMRHFRH